MLLHEVKMVASSAKTIDFSLKISATDLAKKR